jgi:hypothetical protein
LGRVELSGSRFQRGGTAGEEIVRLFCRAQESLDSRA